MKIKKFYPKLFIPVFLLVILFTINNKEVLAKSDKKLVIPMKDFKIETNYSVEEAGLITRK